MNGEGWWMNGEGWWMNGEGWWRMVKGIMFLFFFDRFWPCNDALRFGANARVWYSSMCVVQGASKYIRTCLSPQRVILFAPVVHRMSGHIPQVSPSNSFACGSPVLFSCSFTFSMCLEGKCVASSLPVHLAISAWYLPGVNLGGPFHWWHRRWNAHRTASGGLAVFYRITCDYLRWDWLDMVRPQLLSPRKIAIKSLETLLSCPNFKTGKARTQSIAKPQQWHSFGDENRGFSWMFIPVD